MVMLVYQGVLAESLRVCWFPILPLRSAWPKSTAQATCRRSEATRKDWRIWRTAVENTNPIVLGTREPHSPG